MKILVTGGAGFIGSHLVDELIKQGHNVKIYDNLQPQVHGKNRKAPEYLNKKAEFINADILDKDAFYEALRGVDVLFHQAALVGVGQSMYEIARYTQTNAFGAAIVLDVIANKKHNLKKMIVASSMSIYGEGKYKCKKCGIVNPYLRTEKQLKSKQWKMICPCCGKTLEPAATDELKPLHPTSIYAINKRDHEEMFLAVGKAYKIPAVALRYFNVYGPRQALSNPYTGVCAIFSSRILNNNNPVIFEDGLQTRDFVHVADIAKANILAMQKEEADYEVFNVGSGEAISILKIAETLIAKLKGKGSLKPEIKNEFRQGDIRHCFSDISKINKKLGFKPSISFNKGVDDLIEWVKKQTCEDKVMQAMSELEKRGLA
ncbi:MAG: SDR family NAD(P)-dependent oxidoreductase [Candidatus Omnitrophica bacterium]|nr:SDR family NAD(P)-dependent oxidoreductase [Candidatus Omnitrophota bacterium]